jgi:4'-phosphopantetheinyl transferase
LPSPSLPAVLGADDIHVWRIALDPPPAACADLGRWLDEAERARAARFHRARDGRRFIVAHGVLRLLLGAYCLCRPSELRFAAGHWGKPSVGEPASDVCFNLSHSGEMAVIALARSAEIGVDIEHRRAASADQAIAERFFAPEEAAALRALSPPRRAAAFLRCWTRKEAFIKARGEGFALPLRSFAVSLAPDAPAALLSIDGDAQLAAEWSLIELAVPDGYTAALAINARGRRLVIRDWDHDRPSFP